ncbi:MAG: Sjogren's syndrome/scleroderma autoantigen 1 family protein [Candidatus Helarchaeota archaeon]
MVSHEKNKENEENIQKMAMLLREGNTLLNESCPKCNSPLFKLRSGEIYCVTCDKKVIRVRDDEDLDQLFQKQILDDSIKIINMKIKQLNQEIDVGKEFDDLLKKTRLLRSYLECLEKLNRLKNKDHQ